MTLYRIPTAVDNQIDNIYSYSRNIWGEAKARAYITSLYHEFSAIAEKRRQWRVLPVEFGLDGYFHRYERHFIYWRMLDQSTIGIVSILHERMNQIDHIRGITGSTD